MHSRKANWPVKSALRLIPVFYVAVTDVLYSYWTFPQRYMDSHDYDCGCYLDSINLLTELSLTIGAAIIVVYLGVNSVRLALYVCNRLTMRAQIVLSALAAAGASFHGLLLGLSFYYRLAGSTWLWWEPFVELALPHWPGIVIFTLGGAVLGAVTSYYVNDGPETDQEQA